MKLPQKLALSNIRRTPFAQIAKALGNYPSHHLGLAVARDIIAGSGIQKTDMDGVFVGEGFPFAPNAARVISSLLELPVEQPALTLSNNCVSSFEAVGEAARRILLGEGKMYLALGEESQTSIPFVLKGARMNKKAGSVDKMLKALPTGLPEGVELIDSLDEGLGDGETSYGMPVTAEIVAQNLGISRELSDKFAYQSYKRAFEATQAGKYDKYLVPMTDDEGGTLKHDEAVLLREGIVKNPSRLEKALLLFENPQFKFEQFKEKYGKFIKKSHGPTVTIFNACARSDGASGVLVSSQERAKELGLKPQIYMSGFCMRGVHPNNMGLGQAEASLKLLEEMGLKPSDIDQIEIHEAFAATAVGALEEMKNRAGLQWEPMFEEGRINAFGGSIAIGHPFGATGIRLIANAAMAMEHNEKVNRVLVTACAHGGIAGAVILERA